MKNILILGEHSYIGRNIYNWLRKSPQCYNVMISGTRDYIWKLADWENLDVVIDCAGVAHINHITEDMRELFYGVNRDLTIKIAKHAKKHGVKQFILFSSMNVYGDYCENISNLEDVHPTSFYGDSKLQGDLEVQTLSDETFRVAVVRPPFVYGKGCTGNYKSISKIAKLTPIFPNYRNRKSMIYIENLCEFIRLLVDSGEKGIYAPQNRELVSTTDLVRGISEKNKHHVYFTNLFNWAIPLGIYLARMIRRGFADDCYNIELSNYWDWKYNIVDFRTSIEKTEK